MHTPNTDYEEWKKKNTDASDQLIHLLTKVPGATNKAEAAWPIDKGIPMIWNWNVARL